MEIDERVAGKRVMITGGTGSFGHQIVSELISMNPSEILVISRDEKKQYDILNRFDEFREILHCRLCDVRDYYRLLETMKGIDIIYHAAALKQVPNCEANPFETARTNVIGAEYVRRAAIANGVETVVSVSTDKAVKPVNVMGITKALQEKIMLSPENKDSSTTFVCVRYGNVLGSRGSVVPHFRTLAIGGRPLPITHPEMTRYMLTLPEAVTLVFHATMEGRQGDLLVKKMPACKIVQIAEVIGRRLGGSDKYPIDNTGIRPGEKIHEVLVSEEEMRRAVELKEHFRILPNYSGTVVNAGAHAFNEYTSQNAVQLATNEVEKLLDESGWLDKNAPPWLV